MLGQGRSDHGRTWHQASSLDLEEARMGQTWTTEQSYTSHGVTCQPQNVEPECLRWG